MVVPADKFSQQFDQVSENVKQLQGELAGERHLTELSRLSGMDARALDTDTKFWEWVNKNEDVQRAALHGTVHQQALVLKAYGQNLVSERNKTVDAQRGNEKKRMDDLHGHTTRSHQAVPRGAEDSKVARQRGYERALAED